MKIAHISDIHWRGLARHEEYVEAHEQLYAKLKTLKPDLIINTGDTWHTKTQNITPEAISKVSWSFKKLAGIAPLYVLLGNHDGNLANDSREDFISPIIRAMNDSRIVLLKKSQVLSLSDLMTADQWDFHYETEHPNELLGRQIHLYVFSCFDKDGWERLKRTQTGENKVRIALYHGSIAGCATDSDWRMTHGEEQMGFFDGYDFAMLGDIHKQQFMAKRPDKNGVLKPWIGYPGSMIQQNFGEDEVKGFYVWDIRGKNDWDVEFHALVNRTPFISIPWMGSVRETINTVVEIRGENNSFVPGSRVRVLSNTLISQVEKRQLYQEIRDVRQCAELAFKEDLSRESLQSITTGNVTVYKTSLRNDVNALVGLYREYVASHLSKLELTEEQLKSGDELIGKYVQRFKEQNNDESARDVLWAVKELEFSNLFRYGENNKVDFNKLSGIVGVFGPNKTGKSSVVSALMYGLYNTTEREVGRAVGHYINRSKKNAKCRVRFSANGVNYVIDRALALKEAKKGQDDVMATTTTLALNRVDENGKLVPLGSENDITRNDTDKVIRKIIGTPADFQLTAYSSQGDISRFIDQGATQRKAILNRFLDLDIFGVLNKYADDDFKNLNARTAKYSSVQWDQAIAANESLLEIKKNDLLELEDTIREFRSQVDKLRVWLIANTQQVNTDDLKAKLTKLDQELSAMSSVDLKRATKAHSDAIASVSKTSADIQEVTTNLGKINLKEIEKLKKELMTHKEELEKVTLSLQSETHTLREQDKAVKKLETVPCGDLFPHCRFIKDGHEDKTKIKDQLILVANLTGKRDRGNVQIRELAQMGIDAQLTTHASLTASLAQLNAKLHQHETQVKLSLSEIASLKEKIAMKTSSRDELANVVANAPDTSELVAKNRELAKAKKLLELSEASKNDLLMEIGQLTAKVVQLKSEQIECQEVLSKLTILGSVLEAFSKNGIPAMVLKTQLPILNNELSKILSSVVDFKLVLDTEVSSNTLDVYIEDGHSRRIIELGSGMEKMIASLALRVALNNLSSLPRPDMLIVDEGFGALDEDSVQKCLQLLIMLKDHFRLILVISHIPQVKEVADKMIEIINTGLESRVSV